jgi:uncharacterized protein (DUF302 family)
VGAITSLIGVIGARTVILLLRGRLFPAPVPAEVEGIAVSGRVPVASLNGPITQARVLVPPIYDKEQHVRNMKISDATQVMTKSSPFSVAETVARFSQVVTAKEMKVFAIINHSGEAHEAGLDLPESKVIIFGNPEAGTPVMEAAPLMALELPLKVLTWEDEGRTRVSYSAPGALAERYGLCPDLARILEGIEPLTDAVIMYSANEPTVVSESW